MALRFIAIAALLIDSACTFAESPISYDVAFPSAAHHEAQIEVTFQNVSADPLELRMSRSSPGRYALHEFAKNVYGLAATAGSGRALSITRPDPYQWNVSGHDGTVIVTYTLFADLLDGTYSAIDLTHAHLNMPATFMWARGHQDMPISVTFHPPVEDWKVATQLVATDDPYTFTAPDLDYFLDSPVELSDFSERSWTVESGDRTYTIRLVVHHLGTEEDVDEYAEMAAKVVAEQVKVFGELPEFAYGTYTFICDYLPYADGDGMEHRNSTVVTQAESLYETDFGPQLWTLSHEFLHAWNAERIRPKRLEPFDFERANMSFNLWFVEGFTSYYDSLTIRRAGLTTVDEFLEEILRYLDPVTRSPGRLYSSPLDMSARAPFVDAATAVDPTNFANIHISYYAYGAALGLALDLELRSRFGDVSLDDYMREVWKAHGRTEANYETNDLELALARVTGDSNFAAKFFEQFVFGQELPDFEALLYNAGLLIKKANEASASAGPVEFEFVGREALVANNTIVGSPLYEAGIDRGDQIIAIGRLEIGSQEQWDAALERYEPGSTVTIRYKQREIEREAQLTLIEDSQILVAKFEDEEVPIRRSAQRFRDAWLGPDSESE